MFFGLNFWQDIKFDMNFWWELDLVKKIWWQNLQKENFDKKNPTKIDSKAVLSL